ncbi:MAG: type II secretion system inner membrane protein GspF [Desulfomonilia bacterium]|uniref:Type II secretion system protein F n=1 Tax=anaerobic digester metagenome TaxID=1263854 RepID=A0A485M399_9ZZZZ|nr:type II secretion system inner membrane protein GspF [Pseudomonadota bacterium]HON37799.1 type II secretion system inner membrane protein GspF [Deltaproteobacteria bacterium]HRS55690.1 type II secretion system inner membrane protein GspF [Desulfomonilia bacterium]HPD20835.1 type II secretion system inner membrane protein GspF [Deltaproteobacteria bacterium]HPX18348.1 type II secretion system inner membrane protein GspF [Deltaproteobacteria bacterium]
MALYTWSGFTEKGKVTQGMIDATSTREAKLKLRSQGIFVSSIAEEAATPASSVKDISLKRFLGRVKLEDVTVMTRQLSTLVGASIPLVESLSALYEQTDSPAMKKTVAQVRDAVNEGLSFADALSQHRRVFSDLYVNMVRSGEASGALDVVLLRLAEFLEGQHRLRSKVGAALIYPMVLFAVSVVVLFYLLTSVVPKMVGMFESMEQVLPLPTRILISVSGFLGMTWWAFAAVAVIAVIFFTKWRKTAHGAAKFDRFRMGIPVYGAIYRKISVARFARTLGTLLSSGVPIIESLKIVKTVVQNKVMEACIEDSIGEVMEGSSIAAPLKKSGVFPPIIVHMISTGEKSGTLEEMLAKAADAYEEDVETSVAGLTSILEPVMIVVMGLIVGSIVLAILLPMLEMSTIVR